MIQPPKTSSYFLFGPRGTGKTSWIKSTYKDCVYIDLLDDEVYRSLLAQPTQLLEWIPRVKRHSPIVLDEVQKIPSLLDEVHRLIEKEKLRFILTGSSARKLRRGGANLLAGRALTIEMFPLTQLELGPDFDFSKSIHYGHLPLALTSDQPKSFLNAYINTYLKEEIQAEGLTRNLPNFARFLQVASFSQGSPLVISNIAQEIGIERKVVEDYFSILRDLLLSIELPVFSKRKKRDLITKRKFFYFDVGVFRTLRPRGPLDSIEEINGPALETLILQEMRAYNSYLQFDYEISYWHTRKHQEVDLIMYGPRGFFALEVKATKRLRPVYFEALKEFSQDYPEAHLYMIYLGSELRVIEGVTVVPVREFMAGLPNLLKQGQFSAQKS